MNHGETPGAFTRPASEFYWSILTVDQPARGTRRVRPSRDYLDSLFEEDLPLDLAEVHAVYAPVPDGRFLACAAPRSMLADLPGGTLALTPESIPTSLGLDTAVACDQLNLLVGKFEPRELKQERSKRWAIALTVCVACVAFLTFGLARRAASAHRSAHDVDAATVALAQSALPGKPATLDTASFLTQQELASVRSLHAAEATGARAPDAVAPLVDLLTHLPRTTSLRTDVLAVTPQTITLNVATDADPQAFLKGLEPPPGWTLDEPRLTASRGEGATTLAIQMRRTPQSPSGGAGGTSGGGGAR